MITVITGDDRIKAEGEVKKRLGEEYEVFEGEELEPGDLTGIFLGMSLFGAGGRKILVKGMLENKEAVEELMGRLGEFLGTEAEVVIWEEKIDKRSVLYKKLGQAGVEVKEFKRGEEIDMRAVFNIYNIALRDGKWALEEIEKIENKQDPYMFFGLMVAQALKQLEWRPNGAREKRIVKELGEVDMEMKTTAREPWIIVKSFLVRLSSL
ncbi:hypothetical protein IJG96_00020 [Candidatus Saccharibacteria bacterium]|nr:hypothetical protein [Candidatus Saccharibacteria bacterium]